GPWAASRASFRQTRSSSAPRPASAGKCTGPISRRWRAAMPRLRLTLACGDYDLMRALKDETVKPESIDLTVVNLTSPERHWRMMRHLEFDVCELSMASYMLAKDVGMARYTGIPVFPHRRMRHSFFLVNKDAGVKKP